MEKKSLKKRKLYKKPAIRSEKVLEAGLGATCNGNAQGGRKATTAAGCMAGKLLT